MLKSGGPVMTVSKVEPMNPGGPPLVWCVWFVKDEEKSSRFVPATLQIYEPGSITIG